MCIWVSPKSWWLFGDLFNTLQKNPAWQKCNGICWFYMDEMEMGYITAGKVCSQSPVTIGYIKWYRHDGWTMVCCKNVNLCKKLAFCRWMRILCERKNLHAFVFYKINVRCVISMRVCFCFTLWDAGAFTRSSSNGNKDMIRERFDSYCAARQQSIFPRAF